MLKNPLVTTIKRWKTTPRNGLEAAVRAFFPPIFLIVEITLSMMAIRKFSGEVLKCYRTYVCVMI